MAPITSTEALELKVNIGCGEHLLSGYFNLDLKPHNPAVQKGSLTDLPFSDDAVDEILAEHVFEHLTFVEEQQAWNECHRTLKLGGVLRIEVPDFEWVCETFLQAEDTFSEFYQIGSADHYFGNGRDLNCRWSIITTMFFGNQNGTGQFHYTAYTKKKISAIAALIGFDVTEITTTFNKGGQAIVATLVKT